MSFGVHEPRHEAAVRSVVDRLGGESCFDLVTLSGSRAAGLGHAYSDIDVHVILKDGGVLDRRAHRVDDIEVQLTLVPTALFDAFVALTEEYRATTRSRAQTRLTSEELWTMVRLATGKVLYAADRVAAAFARSDTDVVRRVLMSNFAQRAGRAAEDAAGLLASSDAAGAWHAAKVALEAACELAVAGAGDFYAVDKFLWRRISRHEVFATHTEDLWRLLYQGPDLNAGLASLAEAVSERLFATSALSSWSLLAGWDAPLTSLPLLRQAPEGGPSRSPGFSLQRFTDGWALSGPDRSARVGAPVAATWACLDGRPIETVVSRMASIGFEDVTTGAVDACVAKLVDAGAAVPRVARHSRP